MIFPGTYLATGDDRGEWEGDSIRLEGLGDTEGLDTGDETGGEVGLKGFNTNVEGNDDFLGLWIAI
jgi:hypothetical protein